MIEHRFTPPDVRKLERESNSLLAWGFLFGAILHAFLFAFVSFEQPVPATSRFVPIELIIRPPQRIKPFIVTPRPGGVSKYPSRLASPSFRRPMGIADSAWAPDLFPELPLRIDDALNTLPGDGRYYADSLNVIERRFQIPQERVPFTIVPFFDPGPYRTVVFDDPFDRRAIQGFVHIPVIRGAQFTPSDRMINAVRGLARAVDNYTNLTVAVDRLEWEFEHKDLISAGSGKVFLPLETDRGNALPINKLCRARPVLVYLMIDGPIYLTREELSCLVGYVSGGGTLLIENGRPGNASVRKLCYKLISDMFDSVDATSPPFDRLSADNPLYSAFFDFPEGAPTGAGQHHGARPYSMEQSLFGGRMGGRHWRHGIYVSDKGYGLLWNEDDGYEEQRRMGINFLVHALRTGRYAGQGPMRTASDLRHGTVMDAAATPQASRHPRIAPSTW